MSITILLFSSMPSVVIQFFKSTICISGSYLSTLTKVFSGSFHLLKSIIWVCHSYFSTLYVTCSKFSIIFHVCISFHSNSKLFSKSVLSKILSSTFSFSFHVLIISFISVTSISGLLIHVFIFNISISFEESEIVLFCSSYQDFTSFSFFLGSSRKALEIVSLSFSDIIVGLLFFCLNKNSSSIPALLRKATWFSNHE